MRPGQRGKGDFDWLAVEIRVSDFPAIAEGPKYLIGDVLGIDLTTVAGMISSQADC